MGNQRTQKLPNLSYKTTMEQRLTEGPATLSTEKRWRLLEKGASLQEIAKYLQYVVGEYMGLGELGVKSSNPLLFASQLREWYEKSWRDSHV